MANIWILNSISKRRRGVGDTFLENGIAALRGHVEGEGHSVKVFDWATENDYADITPTWLARFNRKLANWLIEKQKHNAAGIFFKMMFMLSLVAQGLEDKILDSRHERRLRQLAYKIRDNNVKLFGMKVWFGEAFIWAKRMCELVHEISPNTVVIAGGHHPTLYEDDLAKRSAFDLCVISQGEYPMAKLLDIADDMEKNNITWSKDEFIRRSIEAAENGELKNTIYLKDGEYHTTERYERLNGGIHMPKYDMEDEKVKIHVLIESLGCSWGDCHFCVHQHFYDGYQPRQIKSIVDEIEYMRSLGVGIFRFAGSDTPPTLGREIGEEIIRRGLKIRFGMGSRAVQNIGDPEVYKDAVEAYEILIKAGLRAVFMGGECGHPWINEEVMNKGLHPDEIVRTVEALREAMDNVGQRVDLTLAMIYPTPVMGKVTHEEVLKVNIEWIKKINPDSVLATPPAPFKNTRWNTQKEKFGFKLGPTWIDDLIDYEYVLYKPPFLWKSLPIALDDMDFHGVLEKCGQMRNEVEALGIPADISDEYFLIARAAGYEGREGAVKFKDETVLDIVSGDYSLIREIAHKVNKVSTELASE